MNTAPVSRSASSQDRPRISARRAPVTQARRIGTSQSVPRDASRRALSCADVGQWGSRRWTRGRFTAATGFAQMSPSATAWRSADPSTLRTWAMVVADSPRSCIRESTARM